MSHVLRCSGYETLKTDMVRGQGSYLYDSHGRRYVDFEAGVWCAALGHSHWRVSRAMRTQAEQVMHLGLRYENEILEEAAVEVLDTVGLSDGKCVFLSSGSEAVEFGVQVARRVTGRPLLLTLSDSYLAAFGSAGKKSPEEWYPLDWKPCATCPRGDPCDPKCDRLREIPFQSIGALVFEPGNASGLVRFPPRQLVQALAENVRREQGLVVVDEVTTGLGRTGAWYGFEHYDLRPDIVALGKGLGNGYPVSAVAIAPGVAEKLGDMAFRYAQSHQNDPLGCAVAREVLAVVRDERLVERSHRVGAHFLEQLRHLDEEHDLVSEVRGRGLMIVMEIKSREHVSVGSVCRQLLDRGFLVGCAPQANALRFYPPLTIGEDDIEQLLENLEKILLAAGQGAESRDPGDRSRIEGPTEERGP